MLVCCTGNALFFVHVQPAPPQGDDTPPELDEANAAAALEACDVCGGPGFCQCGSF